MTNEYNYNIDKVKFLCAVAVVLIHVTSVMPSKEIATIWNYSIYRQVFDIAVPFFFATSGYLLSTKNGTSYMKLYSKKIFTLYIVSSLFYVLVRIIYVFTDRIFLGTPFWKSLKDLLKSLTISSFFKGTFGAFHIWYLGALFFACLLLLLCTHFKLNAKAIFLLSFLFYMANIIDLFGFSKIKEYGGFPRAFFYLSMGYYVGAYKVSYKKPVLLFFVSMILYTALRLIYPAELSELILALATMSLIISCLKSTGKPSIISKLGHDYSLGIYILHILIYWSIHRIYNYIGYHDFYLHVSSYILVGTLSIVLPIILYKPYKKLFVEPMSNMINSFIK